MIKRIAEKNILEKLKTGKAIIGKSIHYISVVSFQEKP